MPGSLGSSAGAVEFVQTFFVPLPASELQASWQAISGPSGATIGNSIKRVISIAVPKAGTLIYYDHWEDDFEADPANPVQSTAQIWGDGITANGTAPGYPSDVIPAGGVIVLSNNVTLPRVASSIFYDGRDRISTTKTVALAHSGWPISPGSVIGTASEAYDTRKFGTAFQMPVGTTTGSQQQFEYSAIHIIASQNNTLVEVDKDANGTIDVSQTLDMGGSMHVNGGVLAGATVTASKPVQVHEITGDIGSNYESRTFAVRPTSQWSSSYYAPVGTTVAAEPHVVYLYNPGESAITVSYETLASTGTIAVPARGNGSLNLPLNSAAHFYTSAGEPFYAVGANDAGSSNSSGTRNQIHDWGYALMPDSSLTTSVIAPWAPGSDDLVAPFGVPDKNGSPVWITPTAATTVYVNYGGDIATGPNTAPDGSKFDVSYAVPKLALQKIYNPTTFDMSRALIFTVDGTRIAGAWGEDPATADPGTAPTGAPYLDLGYAIIPFAAPIFSKTATLSNDVSGNGKIDSGDTVLFTLFLNNDGVVDLPDAVFTDVIPAGTTYVPNTTVVDGESVPDDVSGTPFPMDDTGVPVPLVPAGNSVTIKFRVTIDAGAKSVTNTAYAASPEVPQMMVATVSFPITPVGISGNVYNDANGMTDSIVNGTGTHAGGTLYANLVSGGIVQQVNAVTSAGTYQFIRVPGNSNYSVVLSTTLGTVGAAAPPASLPAGYVNTGEFFGAGSGSDGVVDGTLSVTVADANVTHANFGIERPPTANAVTSASQLNPGGTVKVAVPALTGTDPEDASVTTFVINTLPLPARGTLYYNDVPVTAGQVISNFNPALLTVDPQDGTVTVSFTYSVRDAANLASPAVTVTMPFSIISIAGLVTNDANGQTDGIVNGTPTDAGGALYANLVASNKIVRTLLVQPDGTFSFNGIAASTTYTVSLSTTAGTVGSAPPAASLPAGYVNTGEFFGAGAGSDGATNGTLTVAVATASVGNVRFGIERPPTASAVVAASQLNPAGSARVTVPALQGSDAEDASITSFRIVTLPTNGILYYNGTAVTAGQTITSFNPALLTVDPDDGPLTVTFTYAAVDAADQSSPAASATLPFTAISISGNVFDDANGLLGTPANTVDGTAYAGATLYANLVSGGNVSQVATVTAGAYQFGTVAPNTSHTVVLSTTSGTIGNPAPSATLPAGWVNTGENIGAGTGSDGTPNGSLAVSVTNSSVSNANFGIRQHGTITGHLYIDTNGNGSQDSGEPDLANVDVIVTDAYGATQTVSTNSGGNWIASVPPGSTTADIDETDPQFPAGHVQTEGTDPTVVTAVAGAAVDAGADGFSTGSISGSVFKDTNGDNNGDTPLAGVVLTLLDGSGNPIDGDPSTPGVQARTAVTGADGSYVFGNLIPGNYQISETQPGGFASVSDADGGNLDRIGDVTPISVAAGQTVTSQDFVEIELGIISGYVMEGSNPIGGVTLTLLDAYGNPVDSSPGIPGFQPFTAVTDSFGFYRFSGVIPGTYQVAQTQPLGYNSFGDADGGDPDIIGDQTPISLLPGQTLAFNNFSETLDTCPDTWAEWLFQHPGQDATSDPDADTFDGLAEFAFAMPADNGTGSSWLGNTAWIIRPSTVAPGTLEGVFIRPKGAVTNVTYTLQYAAAPGNPTAWQSVVISLANASAADNGDCTETVTIPDLEALTGLTGGNGVVRIRADLDESPPSGTDHTSYSEVEGWKETGLEICCRTYNNPFLRETAFSGTVSGVSGQDVVFATSAGAVDLGSLSVSGASFYLEVTSGDHEGHRFDIASASGNAITLVNDSGIFSASPPFNTLAGAPPATLAGDTVVIRRHWTLDEVFPPTGFGATGSQSTADQVQVFAGGAWTIYWLYDEDDAGPLAPRWVEAADANMLDQGSTVIPPGQGLFFNNRNLVTSILAYGEVRGNDFVRPLAAGSNLVGGGYPVNQSANGAGGRAMSPGTGFFGSRDFKTADSVFVWKADSVTTASGYDTYFLLNNAPSLPSVIRWVRHGDTALLPRDSELLLLGNRSAFVRSASANPTHTTPLPWAP